MEQTKSIDVTGSLETVHRKQLKCYHLQNINTNATSVSDCRSSIESV